MSINVRLSEAIDFRELDVCGKGGSATKDETLQYMNAKRDKEGNLYTPKDEKEFKYQSLEEIKTVHVYGILPDNEYTRPNAELEITSDVYTYMLLRDMFRFFTKVTYMHFMNVKIRNVHVPAMPILFTTTIEGGGVADVTFGSNPSLQYVQIRETSIKEISSTLIKVPLLFQISIVKNANLEDISILKLRGAFTRLDRVMFISNSPKVTRDMMNGIQSKSPVVFVP
jgi:hypothetical protein